MPNTSVKCAPEKVNDFTKPKANVNSKAKTDKTKNSSIEDEKIKTTNQITVNDTVNSESDSKEKSVLPTFSLSINGSKFRGLKDGGAQSNFISSSLAIF